MNTATKTIYLQGHTSKETAYEVKDYPCGFRVRTSKFYWIETKLGKGDRIWTYTLNPKSGLPNTPKPGNYSTFIYLYLNNEGHVDHGIIDAYDRDEFEARFEFMLNKLDVLYITEDQQSNIRVNYYQHTKGNAPYEFSYYSEQNQPKFKDWVIATLKHIKTCEFKDLTSHDPKPIYDNPNN